MFQTALYHYCDGLGRTMAAEKANSTVSKLNGQLRYHKVPSHHYNKSQTPDQIEEIKANRQVGHTYKALSIRYGLSVSTIYRYCQL